MHAWGALKGSRVEGYVERFGQVEECEHGEKRRWKGRGNDLEWSCRPQMGPHDLHSS